MRIGQPTSVARLNIDETVTGLWSFANALGLLTDDIGERTGGAGVTVDGMLIRDAGVPEAVITAHEAALAILESQIVDGTLLARLAANEIVTGAWRFDTLLEMRAILAFTEFALATSTVLRTRVTGDTNDRLLVTAEGKLNWGPGNAGFDTNLFRDAANSLKTDDLFTAVGGFTANLLVSILELALATTAALRIRVTGDSQDRLLVNAAGTLLWGTGAAAGDTNLFRAAAGELATADDFNVGGTLDLAGALELSQAAITVVNGDNDDLDIGVNSSIVLTAAPVTAILTGFAGGVAGRVVLCIGGTTGTVTFRDEDAGSVAANRFSTPNTADVVLGFNEGATVIYNGEVNRWVLVGRAN